MAGLCRSRSFNSGAELIRLEALLTSARAKQKTGRVVVRATSPGRFLPAVRIADAARNTDWPSRCLYVTSRRRLARQSFERSPRRPAVIRPAYIASERTLEPPYRRARRTLDRGKVNVRPLFASAA